MTREELIKKMGGSEDRAAWVMEELLRNVKPGFIEMMLKAKAAQADEEFASKEASGYYMDDWKAPDGFNVFSYELAINAGNDKDGSKAAAIAQYELWDQRQIEKSSDRQSCNFFHNMYACFRAH